MSNYSFTHKETPAFFVKIFQFRLQGTEKPFTIDIYDIFRKPMATQQKFIAQNPLILRCHRLIEAFAKSDDEKDFYLDRQEGFLIFVDLDKGQEEIDDLQK